MAAPDFKILCDLFNLSGDKSLKVVKGLTLSSITTNFKFYLPCDVMNSVLRRDPNWPCNSRPFIPESDDILIADARDL